MRDNVVGSLQKQQEQPPPLSPPPSPIPGNMDQKFAMLSESLLSYEPLALRLRDLWFGALEEENHDRIGTRATFLTVDVNDQMERSVLPFGDALWTTISDGISFSGRLPMELKELSTLEKRRRTRMRSQLWTVWMPEHAHICEDWAEERWDILRRASELERRVRAKEGFRSLDDEGEVELEDMVFHRYFQTITRRMFTYVPPSAVNFAPPRWAPDPVACSKATGVRIPKGVIRFAPPVVGEKGELGE